MEVELTYNYSKDISHIISYTWNNTFGLSTYFIKYQFLPIIRYGRIEDTIFLSKAKKDSRLYTHFYIGKEEKGTYTLPYLFLGKVSVNIFNVKDFLVKREIAKIYSTNYLLLGRPTPTLFYLKQDLVGTHSLTITSYTYNKLVGQKDNEGLLYTNSGTLGNHRRYIKYTNSFLVAGTEYIKLSFTSYAFVHHQYIEGTIKNNFGFAKGTDKHDIIDIGEDLQLNKTYYLNKDTRDNLLYHPYIYDLIDFTNISVNKPIQNIHKNESYEVEVPIKNILQNNSKSSFRTKYDILESKKIDEVKRQKYNLTKNKNIKISRSRYKTNISSLTSQLWKIPYNTSIPFKFNSISKQKYNQRFFTYITTNRGEIYDTTLYSNFLKTGEDNPYNIRLLNELKDFIKDTKPICTYNASKSFIKAFHPIGFTNTYKQFKKCPKSIITHLGHIEYSKVPKQILNDLETVQYLKVPKPILNKLENVNYYKISKPILNDLETVQYLKVPKPIIEYRGNYNIDKVEHPIVNPFIYMEASVFRPIFMNNNEFFVYIPSIDLHIFYTKEFINVPSRGLIDIVPSLFLYHPYKYETHLEEIFDIYTDKPDYANMDSDKIDELLLPYIDFNYKEYENDIIVDGDIQEQYIVKKDKDKVYMSLPIRHPLEKYAEIGKYYIDLDVGKIRYLMAKAYNIWQQDLFKFSSVPPDKAVDIILTRLTDNIEIAHPTKEDRKHIDRVIQLFRWLGEMAVLNYSEYELELKYKNKEIDYINKDLSAFDNIATFDNLEINDEYVLTPIISNLPSSIHIEVNRNNPIILSFTLAVSGSNCEVTINGNTEVYSETYIEINKELEKENIIDISFTPTEDTDNLFNIMNLKILNYEIIDYKMNYVSKIGKGNMTLDYLLQTASEFSDTLEDLERHSASITSALDSFRHYFEVHHRDKDKGKRITIFKA